MATIQDVWEVDGENKALMIGYAAFLVLLLIRNWRSRGSRGSWIHLGVFTLYACWTFHGLLYGSENGSALVYLFLGGLVLVVHACVLLAMRIWAARSKKVLVLGVLLLSNCAGYCQERSGLFVSPTRMNILYQGVENPVEVLVPGVKCEDLSVVVSQGTIEGDSCTYTISPERYSRMLTLEAHWIQDGEQRTASRQFRVK